MSNNIPYHPAYGYATPEQIQKLKELGRGPDYDLLSLEENKATNKKQRKDKMTTMKVCKAKREVRYITLRVKEFTNIKRYENFLEWNSPYYSSYKGILKRGLYILRNGEWKKMSNKTIKGIN